MIRTFLASLAFLVALAPGAARRTLLAEETSEPLALAKLEIIPDRILLEGSEARHGFLILGEESEGSRIDLTRALIPTPGDSRAPVSLEISPAGIVAIDEHGRFRPLADGTARVRARSATAGGETVEAEAMIEVRKAEGRLPVDFASDIEAILTREGCNSGACHGKARGQNGFALSLLGFDPTFDWNAIVAEGRGRRVRVSAPTESLLLIKATGHVPHGGGVRFEGSSPAYRLLHRWIESGAPRSVEGARHVESIEIAPVERVLRPREEQRLLVLARLDDGARIDVTPLTTFLSNDPPVAAVDEDGLVRAGDLPGETAILARYMGRIAVFRVLIPVPGDPPPGSWENLPRENFVDDLVWRKLERLRITPSKRASDATFLRRVYLDIAGRLPHPDETRDFLTDVRSDKRKRLVDRLLELPEHAELEANRWADLLRPNPYRVGMKAVLNLDAWLRESFRERVRYDRFVRDIVAAKGSTFRPGPATILRDRRTPEEIATLVSQLFLGVRLECAKCHQHPFERWRQEDFWSFAAWFAGIERKGTGVSPPISGSEEMFWGGADEPRIDHPRTGESLAPRPLWGEVRPRGEGEDPRAVLADWITSPENEYFARAIANRVWADLMGRGLVEPVDDLRPTNPPSNPELLDALAAHLRDSGWNLDELVRTIATSYVYGLETRPNERNVADTRNWSRRLRRRLRAEVLFDAVTDITGVAESFDAHPPGTRAVELWTVRSPSLFLDTFGRPDPNQDPPCERIEEPSIVQALHLMNAPDLERRIGADEGLARRLAQSDMTPGEIVVDLWLRVYSRFPSAEEIEIGREWFEDHSRKEAAEDLLWSLLNSPEFIFEN